MAPPRAGEDGSAAALVTLAAVAGAHGIKGDVRLKLFSGTVEALAAQESVLVGGRSLRLTLVRADGKGAVARFDGVTDRAAAEALRGSLVEVERSTLPPLGEGEYYHADLIGLACEDPDGATIGEVIAVENFGAGDLLEIKLESGRTSLIPFKAGVADLADGRVVLDPDFLA